MDQGAPGCCCWNASQTVRLTLLGGFDLQCAGRGVPLPIGAQRLLAFMAIHESPLLRSYMAEALWPDSTRRRAGANLRCAVWRIRQTGHNLVEARGQRLELANAVTVDFRDRTAVARLILDSSFDSQQSAFDPQIITGFSQELLCNWYDEWLLIQRDCWNQLRLHALEGLAERLLAAGRLGEAVQAALAAVRAEPLRESAHRVLIRVYAAEGNWSDAIVQYRRCRSLLQRELRVPPTLQMEELIRTLAPGPASMPTEVSRSWSPS